MALELEGRIAQKMNVQSGTTARGAWSKQEFIFEYQEGNYPTKVVMHVWGDDKVKELEKYVQKAVDALAVLPESFEKNCLVELAYFTAKRNK